MVQYTSHRYLCTSQLCIDSDKSLLLLHLLTVGGSGVQLLQKALLSAELALGLLRMKNVDKEKAFTQLLQKHVEVCVVCTSIHLLISNTPVVITTQSVLDSTFHLENGLVDRDFPQDTCINEIKDIIGKQAMPFYGLAIKSGGS